MEEFLIIDNNNIFRKLYLKLFVLIKFEKSINIKLKLKKEIIKNSIEENMIKEGEVKEEEIKEEKIKKVENEVEEIKKEEIKEVENEVEEIKEEVGKNECVKNLKHSEIIDIRVNGNLEPLNVEDDNIEEDKDCIYEEKLNNGLKDVDVGCGICCLGCKNIFEYICFKLKKCCNYIMNKCNDKMNNN